MNALLRSQGSIGPSPGGSPDARRTRARVIFAIVACAFFAVDGAIAHSSLFLMRPALFTAAISFDLTIGVTLAYWLMVVRRGHAAARTLLPVFVLSIGAATLTLPAGHRDLVHYARLLAAPFELVILAGIVLAVRAGQRRLVAAGTELDVPERIRHVLAGSLLAPRIADIVATEVSIFYYAFASWRRVPFVPAGARAFSYHKKNGSAGIVYTLAGVSAVEVAVVDLLVRLRAPLVANVLIALGVISTIWLIGFARAIQLRPHFVGRGVIGLRNGLRHHIDLPASAVTSIGVGRAARDSAAAPSGLLQIGRGTPNATLRLAEPVEVRGAYGTRRVATQLSVVVDDPAAFEAAVRQR